MATTITRANYPSQVGSLNRNAMPPDLIAGYDFVRDNSLNYTDFSVFEDPDISSMYNTYIETVNAWLASLEPQPPANQMSISAIVSSTANQVTITPTNAVGTVEYRLVYSNNSADAWSTATVRNFTPLMGGATTVRVEAKTATQTASTTFTAGGGTSSPLSITALFSDSLSGAKVTISPNNAVGPIEYRLLYPGNNITAWSSSNVLNVAKVMDGGIQTVQVEARTATQNASTSFSYNGGTMNPPPAPNGGSAFSVRVVSCDGVTGRLEVAFSGANGAANFRIEGNGVESGWLSNNVYMLPIAARFNGNMLSIYATDSTNRGASTSFTVQGVTLPPPAPNPGPGTVVPPKPSTNPGPTPNTFVGFRPGEGPAPAPAKTVLGMKVGLFVALAVGMAALLALGITLLVRGGHSQNRAVAHARPTAHHNHNHNHHNHRRR